MHVCAQYTNVTHMHARTYYTHWLHAHYANLPACHQVRVRWGCQGDLYDATVVCLCPLSFALLVSVCMCA